MALEHPTGTEQKLLNYECGWKGGDRGGLAVRKEMGEITETAKTLDSDRPSHGRRHAPFGAVPRQSSIRAGDGATSLYERDRSKPELSLELQVTRFGRVFPASYEPIRYQILRRELRLTASGSKA